MSAPSTDGDIFAPGLFAGRWALITGGGSGIGFAIARLLGRLGARVTLAARDEARLAAAVDALADEGVAADWQPVNIRDEARVAALFAALGEAPPDILVNNAGGQFMAEALAISANGFRAVVDLNLNGTWHMCRAFGARAVAAGRGGRIVNVVLSIEAGAPGMAHAGAARAGVINLTKSLAHEWGRHGITVNAVAPGSVATEGLRQYDPALIEAAVGRLPIKRLASPEEIAAAVAYLASPAAAYVTGTTLVIDGGKHLVGPVQPA